MSALTELTAAVRQVGTVCDSMVYAKLMALVHAAEVEQLTRKRPRQGTVRYFLDFEFLEDGHGRPLEVISVGVVCEDGREFYAENRDVDLSTANEWVQANVVPHLDRARFGVDRETMASTIVEFVAAGEGPPEFWAYFGDYDWVLFCQLQGRMIDLPDGWPMFCMDIKQRAVEQGSPKLPAQTGAEHNALEDARWNQEALEFLDGLLA